MTSNENNFSADAWGGIEESYSISGTAFGGIAMEWSNKNNDIFFIPNFENMSQLEIVITPPGGGTAKIGAAYSTGFVEEIKSEFLPNPTERINSFFGIKRIFKEDVEKIKANNAKRTTEIKVGMPSISNEDKGTYQNPRYLD